ncbi:MAG: hypothetical protein SVU32_00955 [Candidatus Nanohaloarchaea archaeon]|nr:hypothetical protein [Candidatus Nanohaloarchaea archaeon]
MDARKLDLGVFLLWPLIAAAVSIQVSATMLEGILLFLVVPSIILALREYERVKTVGTFAVFISVPTVIVVDSIAEMTGTWYIPTVFPWKLYGLITPEAFLWGFFTAFFVVMFYRRFVNTGADGQAWNGRKAAITKAVYGPLLVYTAGFFFLPTPFNVPYFYLLFGLPVIILPLVYEFQRRPELFPGLIQTGAYFFYSFLIYEMTALRIGFWGFPGNRTAFIGWVTLLGERLPLEEFVFFLLLTPAVTVVFYDLWENGV